MADRPAAALRRAPFACVFGAVWILAVAALYFLGQTGRDIPPICKLKALTGVPCPTCGGTRSTFALVKGDLLGAIAFNPWIVALHTSVLISLAAAVLRRPRYNILVHLANRPKLTIPIILITLGLNWIYVLQTQ